MQVSEDKNWDADSYFPKQPKTYHEAMASSYSWKPHFNFHIWQRKKIAKKMNLVIFKWYS